MASTISIRSWRNEIRVARDHPAPERLRGDIEALTADVAVALGAGLDAWVERKSDAVILIRELAFDCDVDVRADRRRAARAVAARCAHALVQCVEGGSADVVRFDTRAAFLARFVADLAGGTAWGQWWYAGFDGVRALPAAAAIRTALVDDPAVGRAALAGIAAAAWPAVLQTLSEDESARILEGLVEVDAQARPPMLDAAAWHAAIAAADLGGVSAPPDVAAVRLLAEALRHGAPARPLDIGAARMLGHVVALRRVGETAAIAALLEGDLAELARVQPALAGALAACGEHPLAPLRALARAALQAIAPAAAAGAPRDEPVAMPAPFAALGLLLEEIDRLLDSHVAAALPRLEGTPTRALAALTALSLASGDGRAFLAWHDATWREFLGIPAGLRWDDYAAALDAAGAAAAAPAQQALEAVARDHQRGTPVMVAFRSGPHRFACRADSNGLWLALRCVGFDRAAGGTREPVDAAGALAAPAGTPHDYATDAPANIPHVPAADAPAGSPHVHATDAPAGTPHVRAADSGAGDPPPFATRLAAARLARADWRDLAEEPLAAALPPAWRGIFVACAQIAWRRLAQRVPGMEGAPIGYLRRNLLGSGGTATRLGADHWRWSVNRPPLHVLIALTGIARSTQTWRGPPAATFVWEFRA